MAGPPGAARDGRITTEGVSSEGTENPILQWLADPEIAEKFSLLMRNMPEMRTAKHKTPQSEGAHRPKSLGHLGAHVALREAV